MKVYKVPLTFAQTSYRYTRPRYQVSVYRTIGPLVLHYRIFYCRPDIILHRVDEGIRGQL